MTGWELFTHVIPWLLTVASLSYTIYQGNKKNKKEDIKEAKECTVETTAVVYKLESIKDIVTETRRDIKDIQTDIKGLEKRVTTLETQFKEAKLYERKEV